ncbi:hypothetical protein [Streptomyces sp. NPDC127072]|uniref:hypothetical protein n=1 Tax=Streptomyces sp. NPDC127072 TaxID=3347129 RepID=UPI003665714C
MNDLGPPPPTTTSHPLSAPVAPDPPPSYPGGGLLPPAGPVRTWGLTVIGVPLLLVLIGGLAGGLASDETGSSDTPWAEPGTEYSEPAVPDYYGTTDAVPPTDFEDSGTTGDTGGLFADPTDLATGTATPATGPAAVVTAYFDAINNRDFPSAWELGGKNLEADYDSFVEGYSTTQHDTITIVSVQGSVVTLVLDALETDGTSRSYDVTYTVIGDVITDGKATPTS